MNINKLFDSILGSRFANLSALSLCCLLFLSGFAEPSIENKAISLAKPSDNASDGQIAYLTAVALQEIQYAHKRFDSSLSSKLFDKYFEYWDPQHRYFLQSDIAEFNRYRFLLDDLTLNPVKPDIHVAYDIFERFLKRFKENVAYAQELLKNEKFVFNTDEYFLKDREHEPFPKDMKEAKSLWKERLRAEYLEEKLGRTASKKPLSAPIKTDSIEVVLSRRYHRNLRAFSDFLKEEILGGYLTALSHLYDPHTDYMTKSELESFAISMNLSLVGIGLELKSEDGYCTIVRVIPGGPASRTQLKAGDRITGVYQKDGSKLDLVDMKLDKVVQYIRGKENTDVKIVVIPEGGDASGQYDLSLVRAEIKLEDQEAKGNIIDLPDAGARKLRIGVIDLPSFYSSYTAPSKEIKEEKSSTKDVAKLLAKFHKEGVTGIILDLRQNGGGSLDEAIKLTGLFIQQGPVVQVKDHEGSIKIAQDTDPTIQYAGPLIVLTSRLSASASEILAGALQDYGRALIVGDSSTFGKGTVQGLYALNSLFSKRGAGIRAPLDAGGAVKVTINKFYRPSGASTQNKGVIPDIVLPSVFGASKEIGESMLDNPLPWDTIKSGKFEKMNLVTPYLSELRKRSTNRLGSDPEYAYVQQDIERFKKLEDDKKISLNEKQRLKQKDEDDEIDEKRKIERLARNQPDETIYEMTLRLANLPGLPPAKKKDDVEPRRTSQINGSAPVSASAGSIPPAPKKGEADESAKVDPALIEARRILVDYISLREPAKPRKISSTR